MTPRITEVPAVPADLDHLVAGDQFHASLVPSWLMTRRDVPPMAKLIYARMLKFANHKNKGRVLRAWPFQESVGTAVGLSIRQVRRMVKVLVDLSLLRKVGRLEYSCNVFEFPVHPWMGCPETWRKCAKTRPKGVARPLATSGSGPLPGTAQTLGQKGPRLEESQGEKANEEKATFPGASASASGAPTQSGPLAPLPNESESQISTEFPQPLTVTGLSGVADKAADRAQAVSLEAEKRRVRKRARRSASVQMAGLQRKQQSRDNLQGRTRPVSEVRAFTRFQAVWVQAVAEAFPDQVCASKFSRREIDHAYDLLGRYPEKLVAQAAVYLIDEWKEVLPRLFSRGSDVPTFPSVGLLSGCHTKLFPAVQLSARYQKVRAEADQWLQEHPHQAMLPAEIQQRLLKAKSALSAA